MKFLKLLQHNCVAGFIGSNLLETLLKQDQSFVGLENFSMGHQKNFNEYDV